MFSLTMSSNSSDSASSYHVFDNLHRVHQKEIYKSRGEPHVQIDDCIEGESLKKEDCFFPVVAEDEDAELEDNDSDCQYNSIR